MVTKYVAPGHRLSDEDWAAVVRRADEVRLEVEQRAEGGASGVGGIVIDMTARGIASKKYFPVSGIPTQLLVLHSAECPLRAGFAISLSEWSSATVHPAPPTASWQRFVDPIHRVRLIPDELGAWHASEANVNSIGWEQSGYARYTREEWTTPDGLAQLELLAFDMAEVAVRDGIPARWLTNDEVWRATHGADRSVKGFCLHRQIDPDTRTDPGNGYPYDLLMQRISVHMGLIVESPTPNNPEKEDDKMITFAVASGSNDGTVWRGDGVTRTKVPSWDVLKAAQELGRRGRLNIYNVDKPLVVRDTNGQVNGDAGMVQSIPVQLLDALGEAVV